MLTAADRFGEHFEQELLETVENHPDIGSWSVAGRHKKQPEDVTWWREHGPGMVANYMKWRATSGWRPWRTPDGELAVELDISVALDNGVPLKMYVDQVMVSQPGNQLVIVDLKTGSRTPDSDLQLGVYRLGIMKKYGIDVRLGAYWMARKGGLSEVFDLTRLRPDLLDMWFTRFRQATDAGIFIPHPTNLCRACAMRDYCSAFGGSKQHLDPDSNGGTSV